MTQSFSHQLIRRAIPIFCFLLFFKPGFAQSDILERQISIPEYSGTAKVLIDKISQTENIIFAYSSEVHLNYEVSFQKKQFLLKEFLDVLFKGKPIAYKVNGNKILIYPNKTLLLKSSNLSQTIRGIVVDLDSKLPLPGAAVAIPDSYPVIGTITDLDGYFRLENVPIGRISLQLAYLGYDAITIPNIEVNSGKEVFLNLNMQESVVKLKEVIINSDRKKGEVSNDLSLLSSHSISQEESRRYTGGMEDPARVVSSFAGIASTPDGSSDIIVRGNSPKYLQWRLDGIEISSPYHMDDQNASFGALTALNNNLLSTSDFYTGAFTPEYGNVLSGVYDVKLRTGNNEKSEATLGVGLMGTDITLEGPLKKDYAGSYLINYRYSSISLMKKLGIVNVNGVVNYQDATFKIVLPTKKTGTFSFFGLGGLSSFSSKNMGPGDLSTPGSVTKNALISKDFNKSNYLLNLGMNHFFSVNKKSYIKTSLYYSAKGSNDDVSESDTIRKYNLSGEFIYDSVTNKAQTFKSEIGNSAFRAEITYSNRINAKNKIQIGTKYTLFGYNYNQDMFDDGSRALEKVTDFKINVSAVNNFICWKYSLNEKVSIVTGIHNTNILINKTSTLEPRVAINWKINGSNSIHAGYGNHSTMESVQNYFTKVVQPEGSITEPNKNLDLLKAHHFVIGYEKRFSDNLMAKIELYYQDLYNLPVENIDTSYYATINEGIEYRYVALVNKGIGKNYGVEITLERFFDNNYYFLLNGSLYDSRYKSLENVWRNTRYNNNYLINILAGKEFKNLGRKNNQTLAINTKLFFEGGQRYIPLLRDANGDAAVDPISNQYWDYKKAYNDKLENIFMLNLSFSYKFNKPRATHEIFLDLMNLTNSQTKMSEYYDESQPGKVGYLTQFQFFPNLMYRLYF